MVLSIGAVYWTNQSFDPIDQLEAYRSVAGNH
jgi:hypothetical protein